MDVTISSNPDDYTWKQIFFIEDYTGKDFSDIFSGGKISGHALIGLAYLSAKKDNPELKIETLENLSLSELKITMSGDPSDPEAKGAESAS